jgi:hypothetical protein
VIIIVVKNEIILERRKKTEGKKGENKGINELAKEG